MIKFKFLDVENRPYLYSTKIYKDGKNVGVLFYHDEDGIIDVRFDDSEEAFLLGRDDINMEAYFNSLFEQGCKFGHYHNKKFVSEVISV